MKSHQILNIIFRFGGIFLNFLLLIFLTNMLEIDEFGKYSYYFSIFFVASIPLQCGFPILLIRNSSTLAHRRLYTLFLGICILTMTLLYGLKTKLGIDLLPTWVLLVFPLCFGVASFTNALLRAKTKILQASFLDTIFRPMTICIFAFIFITMFKPNFEFVIYAAILAFIFQIVLTSIFLKNDLNLKLALPKLSILQQYFILSLLAGLQMLYGTIEVVISGLFFSKTESGFIRVAFQISSLVLVGLTATNLYMQPFLSRFKNQGDKEKFQELISKSYKISLSFSIVVGLILFIIHESLIILIIGEDYLQSASYIKILLLINVLNVFFGPVVTVLVMLGDEKYVLTAFVLSFGVFVAFCICSIYLNYIFGILLASGAQVVLWNFLLFQRAKKHHSVRTINLGKFWKVTT